MPIRADHRRVKRDLLLVGVTVLACAAVFVPITFGSGGGSDREFTIWPNNQARFANMDWVCIYQREMPAKGFPPAVICKRESTWRGLRLSLTGDDLRVFNCYGQASCAKVFQHPRAP